MPDVLTGVVVTPQSEEERTRHLFAVSVHDDENRRLSDFREALRIGDVTLAAQNGVYVRSHRADFALARDFAGLAARYSTADVDRMAPAQQRAAVVACWQNFGRAFRALNVRPFAWTAFRLVCEAAWGYWAEMGDPYAHAQHFRGYQWAGEPDFNASAGAHSPPTRSPTPPPGAWRERVRMIHPGASVILGDPTHFETRDVGGVGDLGALDPPNPTGERHRLWLRSDGIVTVDGDLIGVAGDAPVTWTCGTTTPRRWDCEGLAQFDESTFFYVPGYYQYWQLLRAPVPGLRPLGYACDLSLVDYLRVAIATDASALEFLRGIWRDMIRRNTDAQLTSGLGAQLDLTTARRQTLDDLQEYEGDRRTTEALVNGISALVGPVATAAFGPAGLVATGAVRLVGQAVQDWLRVEWTRARIDVFGRLTPALEIFEIVQNAAQFDALMHAPEMRVDAVAPSTIPPLPAPNCTPERLAEADAGTPVTTPMTLNVGPLGPRAGVPADDAHAGLLDALNGSNPGALPGASPGAPGDTRVVLRVVGMPPGGLLTVDGADAIPGGRWEGDAQAVWLTPATIGPHAVQITAPGGAWTVRGTVDVTPEGGTYDATAAHARAEARALLGGGVNTDGTHAPDATPGGHMTNADKARLVADINPGAMTADVAIVKDHQLAPTRAALRLVHMPRGGLLTVDGIDAIPGGRWEDDSQTVWVSFVDQGPHLVRVDAPGGAWSITLPVTVPSYGATLDVHPMPAAPPETPATGLPTSVKVVGGLLLAGGLAWAITSSSTKGARP